ncbi:MAG: DUF1049 domain-containing protein [Candidatus Dadabacteria bacterium]|nr:DUF1049 domain-containing protein [Candidatus Dadabacteria bacterium]
MKYILILVKAVIFIGLILIIIQNEDVFTHEFELGIDLELWNSGIFIVKNIVLIAAAFLLGVILTIIWGAFSSLGKSSTIRRQRKKIKELESSKPEPVSTTPEPDITSSDYSASETVSSEPHEAPAASSSNDPFKAPS